jgi:hypothetical protein
VSVGDGVLSTDELTAAMVKLKAPLDKDERETFALSIDLADNGRIPYNQQSQILKCYGGGLQELVDKALERVMLNHRQVAGHL